MRVGCELATRFEVTPIALLSSGAASDAVAPKLVAGAKRRGGTHVRRACRRERRTSDAREDHRGARGRGERAPKRAAAGAHLRKAREDRTSIHGLPIEHGEPVAYWNTHVPLGFRIKHTKKGMLPKGNRCARKRSAAHTNGAKQLQPPRPHTRGAPTPLAARASPITDPALHVYRDTCTYMHMHTCTTYMHVRVHVHVSCACPCAGTCTCVCSDMCMRMYRAMCTTTCTN